MGNCIEGKKDGDLNLSPAQQRVINAAARGLADANYFGDFGRESAKVTAAQVVVLEARGELEEARINRKALKEMGYDRLLRAAERRLRMLGVGRAGNAAESDQV